MPSNEELKAEIKLLKEELETVKKQLKENSEADERRHREIQELQEKRHKENLTWNKLGGTGGILTAIAGIIGVIA